MKKQNIKYAVIDIPAGTALCTLEKGGDKDNKAIYRFSDTNQRTTKRIIAIASSETILTDLYNAQWAYTKKGWIKTENHIKWYQSYQEAKQELRNKTHQTKKNIIIILITCIAITIIYKIIKHKKTNTTNATETTNTNEIPLD